jgi:hypothetical protein
MTTNNCIVFPERKWMPVSAWKEMVGLEASVGVSVSSSASLTTSMQNNCLHTNCAPMKKNLVTVEALPILASLCDLGRR